VHFGLLQRIRVPHRGVLRRRPAQHDSIPRERVYVLEKNRVQFSGDVLADLHQ